MAQRPGNGRKGQQRREPRLFSDDDASSDRRSRKSRGRGLWWRLAKFLAVVGFWGAVVGALAFGYIWFSLDQRGLLQIPVRQPGEMILANDGTVLSQEGSFFGDAARISQLPSYVPNAVIAIEDRRFRSHFGIDPIGLLRAMGRNVLAGHMVQGGSTLTQQLAKNLFLSPEKTATRKAQEAVLAIWIESKFTKDEILQLYLNRVFFGSGATGIEQAAHTFFNKSANELTLMEAAKMAASLKAPTTYNPANNPEESDARARIVLQAMLDEGYVTKEQVNAAENSQTSVLDPNAQTPRQYAVDWIDAQLPLLLKNYDTSIVIETTIDPAIQADAETSLRKRLADNAKKLNVTQGAVVVMDTTGGVAALVGGRSYQRSQYNRAVKAMRQPGSAFKPFVYLTAMQKGFTPDSVEVDEPVKIGNWSPENYKHKYLGEVSLETAFAESINTVAAKLAVAVGPSNVAATAERLGITSPLGHDASLALGTSEVTPLELTSAFVPFANGGLAVQPYVIRRITTRDGKVLYERKGSGLGQVVSETELGQMNRLFRAVVRHGTGVKAQFGNFDIGGKTGTSQDYRDAWFVGFTPYYVAGVWLGNDDNSPTKNVTGGSLPTQIWRDVMAPAHQGLAVAILPGNEGAGVVQDVVADANADSSGEGVGPDYIAPPIQVNNEPPRNLIESLFGRRRTAPEGKTIY
ncbi:MAG: PBP1A family penicillin-binding protein [Aestuariivirga sp.]